MLLVSVDGGKAEKSPLNKTHIWRRVGIESKPGHTGRRPTALTTALSLLPKHTALFGHTCEVHIYKFSTELYFLVTNTGVDNADLMCVVPKGSKNIWVSEEAADKNSIGEKYTILCFWKLDDQATQYVYYLLI